MFGVALHRSTRAAITRPCGRAAAATLATTSSGWTKGGAAGVWDQGDTRRAPIKAVVFDKDGTLFSNDLMNRLWAEKIADRAHEATGIPRAEVYTTLEYDPVTHTARPSGLLTASTWSHAANVVAGVANEHGRAASSSTDGGAGGSAAPATVTPEHVLDWIDEIECHLHQEPVFDIQSVLDELRSMGLKLAVCTNDHRQSTETLFDLHDLAFHHVVCADDGTPGKPSVELAAHFAEVLGCAPVELCVVGDSLADVKLAQLAGGIAVGVLSGTCKSNDIGPESHAIMPDASGLPAFLAELNGPYSPLVSLDAS